MVNYVQIAAIIIAGIAVGLADALIKKTSTAGGLFAALHNPWMLVVVVLYVVQILFFIYVFVNGWNLGIVGNLQMVFYSITVVSIGLLVFGEKISAVQAGGIALALVGVVLMNIR